MIELIRPNADCHPRLLDLGCGEGRNAVYFAQNGFDVIGLDTSSVGLRKMEKWAKEIGVQIHSLQADIINYRVADKFDVIFSTGVLHYLPPEIREQRFQNYKDSTSIDGLNVFSVFVAKPFIPRAPDADETAYLYGPGELLSYYWDWEILYSIEEIFDCMSSGIPHKHAVNRVIARRYQVQE